MYNKAGLKSDLVINLTLNQSILLEKLVARRVNIILNRYVIHVAPTLIYVI